MSDEVKADTPGMPEGPRVIIMEKEREAASDAFAPQAFAPQVFVTEETARIVQLPAPAPTPALPAPVKRKSRAWKLGLTGLGLFIAGWLGVDAYLWLASAYDYSIALGAVATAAVAVGTAGVGYFILHELRSFFALRSVEEMQERLAAIETMPADEMRDAVRKVLDVIPKDRATIAAIESFQRKVQRHHSPAQQLELLSGTVVTPLDRRAEQIVRRASARAFGITAISPTAISDAVFFIACSVRMVREIAACYGHRPTAAATTHLLKRLIVEAGKLGAVDLAGATLTQHLGGAVAEKIAMGTAESVYASQRMARLGLVTMGLCRPVPFQQQEVPGIFSTLVSGLLVKRGKGKKALAEEKPRELE
jgi:putative membrane protein